jgi:DNA-binding transcriptional MerR regulator
LPDVPLRQLRRMRIINKLYALGMSTNVITKYLNDRRILTPTGKTYYPELIWVTNKKYKDRLNREKNTFMLVENEFFLVLRGV